MVPLAPTKSERLAHVKRVARRRVEVEDSFRLAILKAHESGASLRQIGEAAGLSHVRILKIVRGD